MDRSDFNLSAFGGALYLTFGHVFIPKKLRAGMDRTDIQIQKCLKQDEEVFLKLMQDNPRMANQSRYIMDYAATPVWDHTTTVYYSDGEPWWRKMLEDLENARQFVFLEFLSYAKAVCGIRCSIFWSVK